jgi:hypothetical protein
MATDNGKLVSAHVQKNSILYLVDCDTILRVYMLAHNKYIDNRHQY